MSGFASGLMVSLPGPALGTDELVAEMESPPSRDPVVPRELGVKLNMDVSDWRGGM